MSEPDYQSAPPGPGLDGRVTQFWRLRAPAGGPPDRIAPDGRCEIILHRGNPPFEHRGEGGPVRQPRHFLYGPLTRVLTLEADGPLDFYAIRLEPWAVGLLGSHPGHWRDRAVDLDEIASGLSARLGALLADGPDIAGFAGTAGPLIAAVFTPFEAMADARRAIEDLEAGEAQSVAALANHLGLGERTLSRRMERASGLTARAFLRLVRFHRARAAIKAGAASLSAVAAEFGYADQAHMTRDFRQLSGETPRLIRRPATFDPVYE